MVVKPDARDAGDEVPAGRDIGHNDLFGELTFVIGSELSEQDVDLCFPDIAGVQLRVGLIGLGTLKAQLDVRDRLRFVPAGRTAPSRAVVRISRGGSRTHRMALSLRAGVLTFVFMIPAAYSVACGDRQLGRGSGCETRAFSNIAGAPIPEFNWLLATTLALLSASLVWAVMSRRDWKPPRS